MPDLSGVTHRLEEARDGVRLHVAEAGDPAAPPVVLLHGWPQHWWMWRHLIPVLAPTHRVLAVDLRGFGWSDAPPTGYRKDELADDVVALLDRLAIERTALVGHDWGAVASYLVAMHHPERVERVVGISAPPPGIKLGLKDLPVLRGFAHMPILAAPGLGPLAARSRAFHRVVERLAIAAPGAWTDRDRELYLSRFREPGHAAAASSVYRTFVTQEAGEALRGPRPPVITAPVLALHGAKDPVSARMVPNAVVIPRTGHFLPEEAPQEVGERVAAFLAAA